MQYKPTNQPTRKNSQNRNISPIWGEAPAEEIKMKICIADLRDVIMGVKSNLKNLKDFDWGGGGEFAVSH